jgi:uncharacterized membrane protein
MNLLPRAAVDVTTTAAAVGAGVTGGVYLAFSTFVMRALDDVGGERAISAMQAINRCAVEPIFMTALFGTAAASVLLAADGVARRDTTGGRLLLGGAVAYLASVALTVAFHVPRNDRLAEVAPPSSDAVEVWRHWSSGWTAGNHVRAACAVAACALFVAAARTDVAG